MTNRLEIPPELNSLIEKRECEDRRQNQRRENVSGQQPLEQPSPDLATDTDGEPPDERRRGRDRRRKSRRRS